MEKENMKFELATGVESLEESIDRLKREGYPQEFISLLERAMNIVSVVVLNFKDATEEDVNRVSTVLKLCETTIKPENSELLSQNSSSLYTLVDSLETVFRNKKFLLGETVSNSSINY